MRCLVLADELKRQGANVRFVSKNLPEHLVNMLIASGIEHFLLTVPIGQASVDQLPHAHWLGSSQLEDARATKLLLMGRLWDWLVVDHYALDERWESELKGCCKKLMVIDDLADRQHNCDVLLDQNFYNDMQTRYDGKVPTKCKLLLGPKYALLRKEFKMLREQGRQRTGEIKTILVFFGGVDANNYTGSAIQALVELGTIAHVDVVLAPQHTERELIQSICMEHGYAYYEYTSRLPELMAAADLAIGAGGTTIWERACLGLPAITFPVADNQAKQINDAAHAGLLCAPSMREIPLHTIQHHVQALVENPTLVKFISNVSSKLVDGRGALRVAREFGIRKIEIRRVTKQDSLDLFAWRNHPAIRAASMNKKLISLDEHHQWFNSTISDPRCDLLIGTSFQQPIGIVRFDIDAHKAEVSIYLVPHGQSIGRGSDLLCAAERWLEVNRKEVQTIVAKVLSENIVSKKFFLNAQYEVTTIYYQKDLGDRTTSNK